MSASRSPAVLFDIDGTLVDSNYLHVHAWARAFHDVGIAAEVWRIHRSIGMDGSALVKTLSGDADDEVKEQLKDLHSRYYKELAPMLKVLPGGREILEQVASMGLQVVLATSAPDDELSILRDVLDRDNLVSEMTSSADVDTAKPQPDIIEVALKRAGVTANRAVFIGDSVWDAEACRRAGVPSIGVLSGGVSRDELTAGGAQVVFEDARELVEHVDDTPIAEIR
ncbi:HAD family hydrolase [Mycobacterium sp.]|uniref:HAD family hydrolase n=1 Tax=Mycobacterium sp. TaxID=1785 RepID=UPI003C7342D2